MQSYLYLVLYKVIFILPLVAIFIAASARAVMNRPVYLKPPPQRARTTGAGHHSRGSGLCHFGDSVGRECVGRCTEDEKKTLSRPFGPPLSTWQGRISRSIHLGFRVRPGIRFESSFDYDHTAVNDDLRVRLEPLHFEGSASSAMDTQYVERSARSLGDSLTERTLRWDLTRLAVQICRFGIDATGAVH